MVIKGGINLVASKEMGAKGERDKRSDLVRRKQTDALGHTVL